MTDQVLVTSNMFYLAILSLYLFCRQPNPPNISANLKTLKLYGLSCGIVPIQVCGIKKKNISTTHKTSVSDESVKMKHCVILKMFFH